MQRTGITVLLVEDDPAMQMLFNILAAPRVDRILQARNGLEGLDLFLSERPDIVITDIQMPGMSGMELLRKLRQQDPYVSCVILTAYSIPEYFIEAIGIGIQGFLLKPLDKSLLNQLLDQLIDAIQVRRQAREHEIKRREAEGRLKVLNEELELRVQERTMALQKEITERVKAQEGLQALNDQLEERVQRELKKCEAQQRLLLQRSRLESMGELAASMAREVVQPLANLDAILDEIGISPASGDSTREYLYALPERMRAELRRIRQSTGQLLSLAETQGRDMIEDVVLTDVIRNVVKNKDEHFALDGIRMIVKIGDDSLRIRCDQNRLVEIISHLLTNARRAVNIKADGDLREQYRKEVMISSWHEAGHAFIEVSDNGIGLEEHEIGNIFEPHFSNGDHEGHLGPGLFAAYVLAREMGGDISVKSKPGVFTTLSLRIPYFIADEDSG